MKQAFRSTQITKEFGFSKGRNQRELSFGVTRNSLFSEHLQAQLNSTMIFMLHRIA